MTAIHNNPQTHALNKVTPKFSGDGIDGGTGGSNDISDLIAEINDVEKLNASDNAGDFFKRLDDEKLEAQIKESGRKPSRLRNAYNSVMVFLSGLNA